MTRHPTDVRESRLSSGADPFRVLIAEHALLERRFARAIAAIQGRSAGPSVQRALDELHASLWLHQRREDEVLYPICERLFGGKDGATGVLRDSHLILRQELAALLRDSRRNGVVSAYRMENLQEVATVHFAKEERVLFPLLAAILSGSEATTLARRLNEVVL